MNDETIKLIAGLLKLNDSDSESIPVKIGQSYLFRTVTYADIGTVTAVNGSFVTLYPAVWIPNTGRFMDALDSGEVEEAEPMPLGTIVNANACVDTTPWPHSVPGAQK